MNDYFKNDEYWKKHIKKQLEENLSIYSFFSDSETNILISEIKRILKKDGLFIGSVNGMQGLEHIKATAQELNYHYYYNKDRYIRLFDVEDVKNILVYLI